MTTLKHSDLLKRGVAEVISQDELARLLDSGRPLRLKQGFDPSRPDIHLGHVVGLRKLRQFQELGHKVVLIIGDWTAQIGDPSGASATRTMLTAAEVQENAQTYMKQFFKIVDRDKTELRWQSEWYGKFGLADVIALTSKFTVAQMLAREDFSKRMAAGRPVAVTELLYPLLQGYDSVVVRSDVEFGGIDQKFNCLVGRELQLAVGQAPQQIVLVPLLVGTDGSQKMSKSLGNYIGVDEPPREMYGKVMSIPDSLLGDYYELLTDVPDAEMAEIRIDLAGGKVNPMLFKKRLAKMLVSEFHGPEVGQSEEDYFTRVFQEKRDPEERLKIQVMDVVSELRKAGYTPVETVGKVGGTTEYTVDVPRLLIMFEFAKSQSEGKRLIAQNAVEIDGKIVNKSDWPIHADSKIRVGKRRFAST